jgi:hypothetical protein
LKIFRLFEIAVSLRVVSRRERKNIMAKTSGVSAATLGKHLSCSRQWIGKLVKQGALAQRSDGTFDQDRCRAAYIKYLKDEGQRDTKSAAASRTQKLRGDEIKLRIAERRGELVEIEKIELGDAEVLGTLYSQLVGLPAACTRDLTQRKIIEEKLNDALGQCRKHFEERRAAVCAGREMFPDDEETDA